MFCVCVCVWQYWSILSMPSKWDIIKCIWCSLLSWIQESYQTYIKIISAYNYKSLPSKYLKRSAQIRINYTHFYRESICQIFDMISGFIIVSGYLVWTRPPLFTKYFLEMEVLKISLFSWTGCHLHMSWESCKYV